MFKREKSLENTLHYRVLKGFRSPTVAEVKLLREGGMTASGRAKTHLLRPHPLVTPITTCKCSQLLWYSRYLRFSVRGCVAILGFSALLCAHLSPRYATIIITIIIRA